LVTQAGQTMQEINDSVHQVSSIIGQITAADVAQSEGISQVNAAVVELDHLTHQNAALVEESAASAQSLNDEAERLNKAIHVFRLDGASGP
jgi:methyl-accepting chemotaxis protein